MPAVESSELVAALAAHDAHEGLLHRRQPLGAQRLLVVVADALGSDALVDTAVNRLRRCSGL